MNLISKNGVTTRKDGLPYEVVKIAKDEFQFRATGNPEKPVVIATTKNELEAIMMLVLQAPEQVGA